MRHEVHEVEHQGDDRAGRLDRRVHPGAHLIALPIREDLLVVDRDVPAREPLELLDEQLVLEGVQAPLVVRRVPPPRPARRDLVGIKPAEDRVAGVGGRRGQDRVVEGLLDLEELREQGGHRPPLVEAHAVEHHEVDRLAPEPGNEELPDEVDRQPRPVLGIPDPARVLPDDPDAEVAAEVGHQGPHGVEETGLAAVLQPHEPPDELRVHPGVVLRSRGVLRVPRERAEASGEVLRDPLLSDRRALQDARHDREDLAGAGRLHEVVVDPTADRLGHRVVLLRLRHHHDTLVRVLAAEDLEHLEPAAARHLLVEQHQVVGVLAEQLEGIVSVGDRVHVVAARLQEQQVRLEEVDFVVHPQDALRGARGLDHP